MEYRAVAGDLLYIKWKCYKTIVGAITWVSFVFYAKCLSIEGNFIPGGPSLITLCRYNFLMKSQF